METVGWVFTIFGVAIYLIGFVIAISVGVGKFKDYKKRNDGTKVSRFWGLIVNILIAFIWPLWVIFCAFILITQV